MGLFQSRKYTNAQRDALLRAVVHDGLTIAEARQRAIDGGLPGVDAFDIPYGSASDIVRRGRGLFEIQVLRDVDHARTTLDNDALQLVGLAHLATEALRAKVRAGETPDPAAVRKAADAITSARRALGPQPRKPAKQPTTNGTEPEPVSPELAELLGRLEVEPVNGTAGVPA